MNGFGLVNSARFAAHLLCVLALPSVVSAQSSVELISPSGRYVVPFSPCRAAPTDDAIARDFHQAKQGTASLAELQEQLEALRIRSINSLSAIEAEVYLLLLQQLSYQLGLGGYSDTSDYVTAIIQGHEHGERIARHFQDEDFVRCAWLFAQFRLMQEWPLQDHFTEEQRRAARGNYLDFLRSALRGEVRTDTASAELHDAAGQIYIDAGFELLPDTRQAAPLFEAGAAHLLEAAAGTKELRHVFNWRRYQWALEKLPLSDRLPILRRLVERAEASWAGVQPGSAAQLDTYAHLLWNVAAVSLEEKKLDSSTLFLERYMQTVQALRRIVPQDPNAEVKQALGYLQLGDLYRHARKTDAAVSAYAAAGRVYETASPGAREMLDMQNFHRLWVDRSRAQP